MNRYKFILIFVLASIVWGIFTDLSRGDLLSFIGRIIFLTLVAVIISKNKSVNNNDKL